MSELFCASSYHCGTTAAASFNENIGAWDTSGVTTMYAMFLGAWSFNEDIGAWDTSGVTSMNRMFNGGSAFNQDIGNWAVHSVTDMGYMFQDASAFDQDIGNSAVQSLTTMSYMFLRAYSFNQNLGWCVKVGILWVFDNTPCMSSSCGVVKMDNCPTPAPTDAPTGIPTAWTTAPTRLCPYEAHAYSGEAFPWGEVGWGERLGGGVHDDRTVTAECGTFGPTSVPSPAPTISSPPSSAPTELCRDYLASGFHDEDLNGHYEYVAMTHDGRPIYASASSTHYLF